MSSTNTTIEWTDKTWNPTVGCNKVSPGCKHCYAETITKRFHHLRLVRCFSLQDRRASRFNEREGEDKDRFAKTLGSVAGRRLTYDELTGKTLPS